MKTCLFVGVLVWVLSAAAQDSTGGGVVTLTLAAGPHDRLVGCVRTVTGDDGQTATVTNLFTELATGMNRFDAGTGAWVPAQAIFEQTADGHVVARQTQHQAILAPNLTNLPAADLLTPDGVRLQSSPYAIGVLDTASGRSVLLAVVQSSQPELISSTEVLYPNAFDTIQASVRYTVGLASWEQEVVLEEAITPELLGKLGMAPATAEVFVMTEFFGAPEPALTPQTLPTAAGISLADNVLSFGQMFMGAGQAFNSGGSASVPVGKVWQSQAHQQFLIESVAYADLSLLQAGLLAPSQTGTDSLLQRVKRTAALPYRNMPIKEARLRAPRFEDRQLVVAEGELQPVTLRHDAVARAGVVLDYQLLNSGQTNYTLRADTTYLVTNQVNLSGTTVLEGGTVIKFSAYTNSSTAFLNITGTGSSVQCKTGPYRPAIFTGVDDLTVGENISSSTNGLSGLYGGPCYLKFDTYSGAGTASLSHIRLVNSYGGINLFGGNGHTVTHAQFVNCLSAISPYYTVFNLRNALIFGGTNAFANSASCTGRCEQITLHGLRNLYSYTNSPPALYFTNSLVVAVTNNVNFQGQSNQTLASDSGVFTSAGAGAHYLAASTYRKSGTTNINASLTTELQTMTTYAPMLRSTPFVLDMVLGPTARRDNTGAPDLGYHYDPLDYYWTGLSVGATNSTVTVLLTNGVAIGLFGPTGMIITQDGTLVSEGAPTNLNHIARAVAVQELPPSTGWNIAASDSSITDDAYATNSSGARLRFTEADIPAGCGALLASIGKLGSAILRDCQLYSGNVTFTSAGSSARTTALTNNLFARTAFAFGSGSDTTLRVYACNNLFWRSPGLTTSPAAVNSWDWHDNLFDNASISQGNGLSNSYNAYVNTSPQLSPAGAGNQTLSSQGYNLGVLGSWYLPASSPKLRNTGSTTADKVGLYHYTTATAQTKQTTLQVDIGFHYVACTNGVATVCDTDGDGLPDYFEDGNGNGLADAGEFNWTNAYTTTNVFGYNDLQVLDATGNFLVNDPQQDYANEQNTQWQPKVVALGDTVIVGYWDSNQGVYGLGTLPNTSPVRMVAYSLSIDGGRTFADMGVPPLLSGSQYGDAGDPVLALDRAANVVYYAATSERGSGAYKGIPLWQSNDKGASFVPFQTVSTNIASSDYPWIAVDDWPGTGQHDVYTVIAGAVNGTNAQWLTISTNVSANNWGIPLPLGDGNSRMPQLVVGSDHVVYAAWKQINSPKSLQICTISNRGATIGPTHTIVQLTTPWVGADIWMRLLRSNTTIDTNDYFKAFNYTAMAVNPDSTSTNRSKHLYVAYADKGTNANDRCDIFFVRSSDGGITWPTNYFVKVNTDSTTNDQWMPAITVRPDGNQLFIGWLDRRNDTNNSLIDAYGRWATISADGTVAFTNEFRITTQSFPPTFSGTLNTSVGSYDPVWAPGGVYLRWWYDWWDPDNEGELTAQLPDGTGYYSHEAGEHNGAFGDMHHVYFVWPDNRVQWTYHGTNTNVSGLGRYQPDIRLARLPWPP